MSDIDHVDVTTTEDIKLPENECSKCAYCGCQKDGVLVFYCEQCHRWIHASCLHAGPPSSILADNYFNVKCSNCSGRDKESFERLKLTWSQVITITLYNLAQTSLGKQGFFKWKEEVCDFIDIHWEDFFGKNKKRSPQWSCTIASVLSSGNPYRFLNGYGLFEETGWWRLVDPTKVPEYDPSSVSTSAPKSRNTRKSHFSSASSARSNAKRRYQALLDYQANRSRAKQASLKDTREDPLKESDNKPIAPGERKPSQTAASCHKPKLRQDASNDESVSFVDSPRSASMSNSHPASPASSISSESKTVKEVRIDPVLPLVAISDNEEEPDNILEDRKQIIDENTNAHYENRKGRPEKYDSLSNHGCSKQNEVAEGQETPSKILKTTLSQSSLRMMSLYDEKKLLKKLLSMPSVDDNLQARCLKRKLLLRQKKRELGLPVLNFDATVRQLLSKERGLTLEETVYCRENSSSFFPSDYRILDRFFSKDSRFFNPVDDSRTFRQKLVGCGDNTQLQTIVSPYTQRILKPYIRRDFESKPTKLKLLEEILSNHHRSDPSWRTNDKSPIDFCYVLPHHIPSINSLCNHFFWPGVDLSESLQYPDFSVVALYKKMVIGFGFLVPDVSFNEAYISFLLVHPDWQRAGIGTFMLYHLIQTCMGKDVTLHVSASNPAMLLYQRFGFKPERFEAEFYDKYMPPDTVECTHAFFMRLRR